VSAREQARRRGRRAVRKGRGGEGEVVELFEAAGFDAQRGSQRDGEPDVVVEQAPWLWPEVKRTERLDLERALTQATDAAGEGRRPVLFHRRSRTAWLVVLDATWFIALLAALRRGRAA
jgi:Holliday junction resolvase